MNYPKYQEWLAVLARRDSGLLLVVAVALVFAFWLCYARYWWPRLLPKMRIGVLAVYYIGLVLFLWGIIK